MATRKKRRATRQRPTKKSARGSKRRTSAKRKPAARSRRKPSPKTQRRAQDALRRMRQGKSLTRAARAAHTTPATVKRYERGIVKRRKRRFVAEPYDRQPRQLKFLSPDGIILLDIRDSRVASRLGSYWSAVDYFLRTGDTSRLRPFQGKSVRSGGQRHAFLTDPQTIERLANAGVVSFEEIYHDTL